ncbi:O-methylsterigmatocystin oxidoreductase [Leucoagaricus sp. SymC.cos]|nr:O-methylsterigmatocystin oxidoreductase [Leucoagaricus sp. SymC.cos]
MIGIIAIVDFGLGLVTLLIARHLYLRKRGAHLPPGPGRLPLIGNLLDMPKEKEWLAFADWGEKYGDLVSVSILGKRFIIVNSVQIAVDMLEKKGSIYSERPIVTMGGELIGWKNAMALLPYGERLRSYRRLFYHTIGNSTSMSTFHSVEEAETHKFLKRLVSSPQYLAKHIRHTSGAIILHISHGYEVKESDDPLVELADTALGQFSLSMAPGGFVVNLVPLLRYIPEWFPGAKFKKVAREWEATLEGFVEKPHRFVKDQMDAGIAPQSYTASLLADPELTQEKEFNIKWSAASMYGGGADTTVSSIYAFFKAMALYPEVAAAAQAEIDAVVGSDRLPSFADREDLPYINALILEVLRWHTVGPTGIPHAVKEDNIHNGYLIPKGALVITNIWQMQRDPKLYDDPLVFNPKRFLGPNPQCDPRKICFGFGRRICPGRVMAEASIFISCVMTLAVFDISKYVEEGRIIEPVVDQTTGTISHPTAFQCTIKVRSQKALDLILGDI